MTQCNMCRRGYGYGQETKHCGSGLTYVYLSVALAMPANALLATGPAHGVGLATRGHAMVCVAADVGMKTWAASVVHRVSVPAVYTPSTAAAERALPAVSLQANSVVAF